MRNQESHLKADWIWLSQSLLFLELMPLPVIYNECSHMTDNVRCRVISYDLIVSQRFRLGVGEYSNCLDVHISTNVLHFPPLSLGEYIYHTTPPTASRSSTTLDSNHGRIGPFRHPRLQAGRLRFHRAHHSSSPLFQTYPANHRTAYVPTLISNSQPIPLFSRPSSWPLPVCASIPPSRARAHLGSRCSH